jgi:hypothetical protein
MQRVILDIPESKLKFFMELADSLGFKNVQKLSRKKKELVDDLKQALSEVEQHRQGKIQLQSAKDFLNEL